MWVFEIVMGMEMVPWGYEECLAVCPHYTVKGEQPICFIRKVCTLSTSVDD
eukprot:UN05469